MTGKQLTTLIVGLMIATGVIAGCAGFDFGDVVQVETPREVQQRSGIPGKLSLNEAEVEYQAWYEDTQRAATRWKAEIERRAEIAAMLRQITLQGLNEAGPMLAGVPVLGPAVPAAVGLLTFMLGAGRKGKEKEKSYNAGLAKGKEMASQTITPTHLNG